ncbi:MAG TPA: S4 domain-containing protein, partial [Anaerovoracaceae bacterium]|nr:S4 domain-containing protein [Anaerovoracaceae bacterium]
DKIIVPESRFEEKRDTVASLRLDNLIASAFSLSRGRATSAIEGGVVFVNGLQSEKADRQIKEGDKLVLRGKGKVLLKAVGGVTKKDRISIVIHKYL